MYLAVIIILASFLTAISILVAVKFLNSNKRIPRIPTFLKIFATLLLLSGLIFTTFFSFKLQSSEARKTWPSVNGVVLSSEVIGDRAFRPDIEYQYVANKDTLRGKSFLNQPGFGGRMNRLDAAEKNVLKYKAGTSITVFYNPKFPEISTLFPGPAYSLFLKLGSSTLFLLFGATISLMWLLQKKQILR